MANKKISALTAAAVLTGAELVELVQSGANVKSTAQDIADLASAGGAWGSITGTLSSQTDLQSALDAKVAANAGITGATKTKITYDAKGLVTAGADATTADIADSSNKRYVTDAQLTVIGNTSGTNTGDQTITLSGDVTGSGTGSFAATIANGAVTLAKMADMATASLLGRNTGGAGVPEVLSASTAKTLLSLGNVENTALSTWAGTANITTIGTIATGTWNATTIGITKGGTGLTALGTALQQLRVNAGGTALEYFTPSASSGDITNGGNTTGAAIAIGTNDAFGLNLETNNVTRMAITGGASTGGQVTITNVTANTNTVSDGLTIQTNSTGTAAASFGGGILFQGESSTTDNQDMVRLSAIWTTATHASRTSALVYSDVSSAGAIAERFRFTPSGITTAGTFTLGNSAQVLILGGSTGVISLTGSINSTAGIEISNTVNAATSVGAVQFGSNQAFTQTSGTRNILVVPSGFSPTSGTAVHSTLAFTGTFNQTGGANGIVRGIYLNQTLTAVADFRALEIAVNHASAKGIYQTGSSTTNNFVGGTMFGSTSAVSAVAAIEISSTTKGILLPRMTEAQRDAISAVAGLLIYNTTTNKLNIYTTAWEAVTSA